MSKEAMKHYEAALKEAFPSGATGDVFHHWNEARKALAEQPAQHEPVAWCVINNGELIEATFYRDYAEEILAGQIEGCGSEIAPLYTSPPAQRTQRTWVGLSDAQSTVIWANSKSVDEAIRATEKQLMENNI